MVFSASPSAQRLLYQLAYRRHRWDKQTLIGLGGDGLERAVRTNHPAHPNEWKLWRARGSLTVVDEVHETML